MDDTLRIAAYESRLAEMEQGGGALSGELTLQPSGNGYALSVITARDPARIRKVLAVLQRDLAAAQSALAAEQARETVFTRRVDMVRATYQSLTQRREELRILLGSSTGAVRLAVPDIPSGGRIGTRPTLLGSLAAILGFAVGAVLALGIEAMRGLSLGAPVPVARQRDVRREES